MKILLVVLSLISNHTWAGNLSVGNVLSQLTAGMGRSHVCMTHTHICITVSHDSTNKDQYSLNRVRVRYATETEMDYFAAYWEVSKWNTWLSGQGVVGHLWHCLDELRKKGFSYGINHINLDFVHFCQRYLGLLVLKWHNFQFQVCFHPFFAGNKTT